MAIVPDVNIYIQWDLFLDRQFKSVDARGGK